MTALPAAAELDAVRDAIDIYAAAVLEAAGHPAYDPAPMIWSGPCGHNWLVTSYAGTGAVLPIPDVADVRCPICHVIRQRDSARELAVLLECEVARLAAGEPEPLPGVEWLWLRVPVASELLARVPVDGLATDLAELAGRVAEREIRARHAELMSHGQPE